MTWVGVLGSRPGFMMLVMRLRATQMAVKGVGHALAQAGGQNCRGVGRWGALDWTNANPAAARFSDRSSQTIISESHS